MNLKAHTLTSLTTLWTSLRPPSVDYAGLPEPTEVPKAEVGDGDRANQRAQIGEAERATGRGGEARDGRAAARGRVAGRSNGPRWWAEGACSARSTST